MLGCGMIVVRDKATGREFKAAGPVNIAHATICYINDLQIKDISLPAFPLNYPSSSYFTDLILEYEPFRLLKENKVLQSKIFSVELEYEGVAKTAC
jgi:hypothetical protein